jgi:hypothetical protein
MSRLWACLVLLSGLPLLPATLERLSLEDMIARSTNIVRARVTGTYTAPRGPVIYTHVRLQILENWKGSMDTAGEVVIPGGASGGFRQHFSGAPTLSNGKEYVLFLWRSRSGLTHVIGLSQGLFRVETDRNGDLMAHRVAVTEGVVDAAGRPSAVEAIHMPLAELSARIRSGLGDRK